MRPDDEDASSVEPGAALLWGVRQSPTRGPKPALRVEQIVGTAVDIADAEGLAVLSMQRLATDLGVGTMSLYRYLPGKSELESLMLDAVIGDPPTIEPRYWRRSLRRWARGNRDIFRRHPWTLTVAVAPRLLGPNETAWTEAALRAVSHTGLPADAMLGVVYAVNSYVRGAVQLSVRAVGDDGPRFDPGLLRHLGLQDRYPILMGLADGPAAGSGPERAGSARARPERAGRGESGTADDLSETQFEFGLARVLDGVQALIDAG